MIPHNVRSTISVVIVAGECGIVAGTPLAILGAIGRLRATRFDYQGGLYQEALANIDTILLDKTGTLTYGIPEVVDVRPTDGISVRSLLQATLLQNRGPSIPQAKAILKKTSNMGISGEEPERFEYTPGKGVVATRDSVEIIGGNRLSRGSQNRRAKN